MTKYSAKQMAEMRWQLFKQRFVETNEFDVSLVISTTAIIAAIKLIAENKDINRSNARAALREIAKFLGELIKKCTETLDSLNPE